MTEITLELPTSLANKIKPLSVWLPTIIELSLVGFRTRAAEVSINEVIEALTARARVTVRILRFNQEDRIEERRELIENGLF